MSELTIIGRGPSWKECSFATLDLWGTVTCMTVDGLKDKNFTKLFYFDDCNAPGNKEGLVVAKERGIPTVSLLGDTDERYPLREVIGDCRSSYFLNSMSYMLAYAIHLKYSKMHIYGLDQGPSWQLQQGKSHISFWVGFAIGRGIEVDMGRGSLRWAYNIGETPVAEPVEIPETFRLANGIRT